MIAKVFNPAEELIIHTAKQTNEANVEIETQLVTVTQLTQQQNTTSELSKCSR